MPTYIFEKILAMPALLCFGSPMVRLSGAIKYSQHPIYKILFFSKDAIRRSSTRAAIQKPSSSVTSTTPWTQRTQDMIPHQIMRKDEERLATELQQAGSLLNYIQRFDVSVPSSNKR